MEIRQFFDNLYTDIHNQHDRLDEIILAYERFNPVRVEKTIGEVINAQHQMAKEVEEFGMEECEFKGLVDFVSQMYSSGELYCECANPNLNSIPNMDFTQAFVEETRGMLYVVTFALNDSTILTLKEISDGKPLKVEEKELLTKDGKHYLIKATDKAVEHLTNAIKLSSETTLARSILNGAKQYQERYR